MRKIISIIAALSLLLPVFFTASVPVYAKEGLAIAEAEAKYFDVKPTIDGMVTENEWGEPTAAVSQADVGNSIVINKYDKPEANDYNTFFYRNLAMTYDAKNLTMSYTLWIRWDENYYYLAVKVNDPDGHSLKNGKNETWNGDALQFRLDPDGYNASCALGPECYDAEYDGKPWGIDTVPDFCVGFVQMAGGFTEAWKNSPGTNGIGITPFSGGTANVAVVPAGAEYSTDSAAGITTYEIAIPWKYIDNRSHYYSDYTPRNPYGAIGREYGMSAVVYNADGDKGEAVYNAALAWGSGILNVQQDKYTLTCGGSNKIMLSAERVSDDEMYSAYYPHGGQYFPSCSIPEYDVAINEEYHTKLDYEDEDHMDVIGYKENGEWIKEPGNTENHVARWDLEPDTDSGLNECSLLSTWGEIEGEMTYTPLDCSYTFEYDVMVTDVNTFEPGYDAALYHWFGGVSQVDYMCGYDFDLGKFFIEETRSGKRLAEWSYPFILNEWHHIVFQYFRDNCEIRFYFDPEIDPKTGRMTRNAAGEPVFRMSYRYFDMSGIDDCAIILKRMNCQILLDNVEFYNFVDFHYYMPDTADKEFGDANCDGDLDMKDVLLMRRNISGLEKFPSDRGFTNANVILDGEVNMKDVLLVRRVIAGLAEAEFVPIVFLDDVPPDGSEPVVLHSDE